MGERLPQIKPRQLVKILEKFGFIVRRQTGSHVILRHPVTKHITCVPVHSKDIKKTLLFAILKQSGISQKEFIKIL